MDNCPLQDHSTIRGRFHLLYKRLWGWKWSILGVTLTLMLLISVILRHEDPSIPTQNLKGAPPLDASQLFEIVGKSAPLLLLETFNQYPDLASQSSNLRKISLRNVIIHAPSLSQSLINSPLLEEIELENVSLLGNFTPVTFQHLLKFSYNQHPEDKRDSYKSPETLHSTLFFGGDGGASLLNLNVELKVSKGGTKLLEISKESGELYLNVKYCQLILSQGPFPAWASRLSLIGCNITSQIAPLIPPTLKYLNLRNAIPSSATLKSILKPQKVLEEFYGYLSLPTQGVSLDLSDLPSTTKKVGLDNLDITFSSLSSSSIEELFVGDLLSPQLVNEWGNVLGNVRRVGVFNISSQVGLSLLKNVIEGGSSVESLVWVGPMGEESVVLSGLGIGKDETAFVITTKPSISARVLTQEEQDRARYEGLGFDVMDTFTDYIKWDSLNL